MSDITFYLLGMVPSYLLQMVLPALFGALVWAATRPLRRSLRDRRRIRAGSTREWGLLFYFMFTSGLLALTLTPAGFWPELLTFHRLPALPQPFQGGLNLAPFWETWKLYSYYARHSLWSFLLINFLGNIVMFMPNGFFAGLLMDKPRWWKVTLATFGLSLFIEVFQLFVSRGTDVDDLILNTLGGLLGYWVFLFFRRLNPGLVRRCAKSK